MLKWTSGAAIIVVIIAIIITWGAERCETTNRQSQTTATAQPLTNPMLVIATGKDSNSKQEQSQQQASRTAAYSNSYFCSVVTPTNLPTIYLVLIGIGGIGVAIGTLKILESQTKATQDAAEAASLNAKALVDSERPWLCIPMGKEFVKIETPILIESRSGEIRRSYCAVWLKNFGRSPARIVEQKMWLIIGEELETIPDHKAYGSDGSTKEDYIFPPGENIRIQATFNGSGCIVSKELEQLLKTKSKFLWLCGFCRYMDTFNRKDSAVYESRFCYRWISDAASYEDRDIHINFWIMAGPREYNRAT